MRVTIKVDSATPEEIYDLTLAYQRTTKTREYPDVRWVIESDRFAEQMRDSETWQQHVAEEETRHALSAQSTYRPTVSAVGVAMGWESPALHTEHAADLLTEYASLHAERESRKLLTR